MALSTSEYLLSSLRWGWFIGGVSGGVDLIFINISRVAHAQRAASLPTNPRGPHVEQIEEARKETERREKVREDGGGEARGKGDEKRAPVCMRVQLLMSVCIGYERSVVSGERERERDRGCGRGTRLRTPVGQNGARLYSAALCKVHPSPEFSLSLSLTVSFSFRFSRTHPPFSPFSLLLLLSPSLLSISYHRSRYSLMRMQNRRSFSG